MIDFKKDRNLEPVDENLNRILGNSFSAYKKLLEKLPDFEADLEWRFYKDGGWLAKVTRKKKTLFWGEPRDGHFTAAFHFNERNHSGVLELDIADDLRKMFSNTPASARNMTTLKIDIYSENDLPDVYQLIGFKKNAK
ncbi:DUF3788 family protein [Candidatus Enterococcus ferrettii]|uniref:DUF3788 family protein n=1 Tax=Candidatus Enterococcus ferrettii TaxID=2815324 RepID=A0ABV0ERC2_9ENTE|nr:DUF3788 family protein [Enterococcus sp. 665A]MBO1342966.1 DUF3788 family protein [Enterococcus sp. 665A]